MMSYGAWRISYQDSEQAARAAYRNYEEAAQGQRELRGALSRIVRDFDALNGAECKRGCGSCIKCIAQDALRGKGTTVADTQIRDG